MSYEPSKIKKNIVAIFWIPVLPVVFGLIGLSYLLIYDAICNLLEG